MNKTGYILLFFVMGLMPLNLFSQEDSKEGETNPRKNTNSPVEIRETEGRVTETKLVPITDPGSVWNLAFYGFVKADYIYASNAALSYGREVLQGPNQAKRQVQRDDFQSRQNIQLQDSRIGFKSKYGKTLSGVIELDFIDFDKSSPNVNVRSRLRQAYVKWEPNSHLYFFAGQKWEIFSPLNPDTYNVISNLFYLGNVGWMREQFGAGYKFNKEWMITTAIGNTGVNTSASPSTVEKNRYPTLSGQIKWTPSSEYTMYLSGITVRKLYADPDTRPSNAAGKSLFYDGSPESFELASQMGKSNKIYRQATGISLGSEYRPQAGKLRFKWEGIWGKNLADLNTLGVGQAQMISADNRFLFSQSGIFNQSSVEGILNRQNPAGLATYNQNRMEVISIYEASGWLSMVYQFDPSWEAGVLFGASKITNPKDLVPAFSTASDGTVNLMDFSKSEADPTTGIWSPGSIGRIRESGSAGYNLTFLAQTGLKIYFQHEFIQTFYQDAERQKGLLAHIKSVDLDTGRITLQNVIPGYLRASERATVQIIRIGTMYNF